MMKRLVMQDREGAEHVLLYDPHSSAIQWADGEEFVLPIGESKTWQPVKRISRDEPGVKSHAIRKLKIQLGLKCNYSCSYCLQSYQRKSEVPASAAAFLAGLDQWFDGGEDGKGKGVKIEFWGGEPFLYWKELKPLGLALKDRYPNATFSIVTNGSLLTSEINNWIMEVGLSVGISHDGPGQHLRGIDPFENDEKRTLILDLYDRLLPSSKVSFNAVLTREQPNLDVIADWFDARLEGRPLSLTLEGVVIPYHPGGHQVSIEPINLKPFVLELVRSITAGRGLMFHSVRRKIEDFSSSLEASRPSSALGQKCGMDREDNIAVTLSGEIITCQNVNPASSAQNGMRHRIGSAQDLKYARLTTAHHWAHRKECVNCAVLQLCKGSCMFLEGVNRIQACENEFAWNLAIMSSALYLKTGMFLKSIHDDI